MTVSLAVLPTGTAGTTRRARRAPVNPFGVVGVSGIGALAGAWLGAVHSTDAGDQIFWVAVALTGTAGCCGAMVSWLVASRRLVARRIAALTAELTAGFGPVPLVIDTPAADQLVALPGMARYHLASCQLVAGKAVVAASRPDHAAAGRSPCGLCAP
jgi:hypothetical protein